jgi:hypothetical protein
VIPCAVMNPRALRVSCWAILLSACGSSGPGSGFGGGGQGGRAENGPDAALDGRANSGGSGGIDAGRRDARPLGQGGQIGSGDGVSCADVKPGGKCGAGSICCDDFPKPDRCVSQFSDCACAGTGDCTPIACDGPEDCPGGFCCAATNYTFPIPEFDVVSCKPTCGEDEHVVCREDKDCPGAGQECNQSSVGDLKRCFF